jgi:cyclophilin family peptidyl-prolyl cis-trans isomerase
MGLPAVGGEPSNTRRIVIGLFGKDSPQSVAKLKSLMSNEGLPAACKPKEQKLLQKDQLEANKIYNNCVESQQMGVNYDYAQIWRVQKNQRIDFGSLAGRFIARESPTWEEKQPNNLRHDRPYLVSVRRGSDSGFSFTVYPGGGDAKDLDENQIIIGQVIDGMDVVDALNEVPIVKSANVNYMGLTGGPKTKDAPTRSCFYGGDLYCNENKPLIKLQMYRTGVLQ